MSERESAQFSDSTNQILRALDGESVTRNPAFSATTNAILDAIEEGGGGNPGYDVVITQETVTTIPSQTATGVSVGVPGIYAAQLSSNDYEAPDTMSIMFDNVNYECAKQEIGQESYYGADMSGGMPDFTTIPFVIGFGGAQGSGVYVGDANSHTISATAVIENKTVTPSEDFTEAAKIATGLDWENGAVLLHRYGNDIEETLQQIYDKFPVSPLGYRTFQENVLIVNDSGDKTPCRVTEYATSGGSLQSITFMLDISYPGYVVRVLKDSEQYKGYFCEKGRTNPIIFENYKVDGNGTTYTEYETGPLFTLTQI